MLSERLLINRWLPEKFFFLSQQLSVHFQFSFSNPWFVQESTVYNNEEISGPSCISVPLGNDLSCWLLTFRTFCCYYPGSNSCGEGGRAEGPYSSNFLLLTNTSLLKVNSRVLLPLTLFLDFCFPVHTASVYLMQRAPAPSHSWAWPQLCTWLAMWPFWSLRVPVVSSVGGLTGGVRESFS